MKLATLLEYKACFDTLKDRELEKITESQDVEVSE